MPEMLDRPPTLAAGYDCWLPRHRRSAAMARSLLREFLLVRPGGEPFAWAGELLLSELVTNAITHARVPPGRLIRVRFELGCGELRIEVHDASAESPTVRQDAALEESGRGMHLVESLSTTWGVHPRPGAPGKVVWATVAPTAEDTPWD